MPLNLPLDAFSAGQQAGRAASPVSGLGDAIRGILDTARKGGMLQVQSQAQAAGANQNAILSEGRAAERGKEIVQQQVVGPGGRVQNLDVRADAPRPVTEPAQPAETALETIARIKQMEINASNNPISNTVDVSQNPIQQNAANRLDGGAGQGAIFANNGSQRIKSVDGGVTWTDANTGEPIQ